MGLFDRIFGARGVDYTPLYARIVELARAPEWYRDGGAPDTLDGRFDMVALVLSLVLLRLERDGPAGRLPAARLTEVFVRDMDGQMREIGFGDLVVGKQIGRAMSALGGRLGAYRGGVTAAALTRNLWRDQPPGPDAIAVTLARAQALEAQLAATPTDAILAGAIA